MDDLTRIAINDTKHDLCDPNNTYSLCHECYRKDKSLCDMDFESWEAANRFADTLKENPHQFDGFQVRNYEHLDGSEHGVYFVNYWA